MNNLLFVYGTLLLADNEFGNYLRQHCEFIAKGKVKGVLYDLGEYPGLLLSNGNDYVQGSVYRMTNAPDVLKQLDHYEGVGPNEERPNLYQREEIDVETGEKILRAWVYVYNRPVLGFKKIKSGDYLEYTGKKYPPA